MDEVTQQNASLVEEAAAAAASMQEQTGALSQVVSIFKIAPAGKVGAAPARLPSAAVAQAAKRAAPMRIAPAARAKPVGKLAVAAPALAGGDWEEF
jgi:hypothetical protein